MNYPVVYFRRAGITSVGRLFPYMVVVNDDGVEEEIQPIEDLRLRDKVWNSYDCYWNTTEDFVKFRAGKKKKIKLLFDEKPVKAEKDDMDDLEQKPRNVSPSQNRLKHKNK